MILPDVFHGLRDFCAPLLIASQLDSASCSSLITMTPGRVHLHEAARDLVSINFS